MMLLDDTHSGGGGDGPWCPACKQQIVPGQRTTRLTFATDPHGFKGLSGEYHFVCGKPFASIASALDMLSRPFGN